MDVLKPLEVIFFLALFMPGFISIKVYELVIASNRRNFSDSVLEAIGYSVLNFAVLSWLILYIADPTFYKNNPICFYVSIIFIFFVFPIIWPLLLIFLSKFKLVKKYIISPISMPWDEVFGKREAYWVIIHTKDGRKIGGKYGKFSRASAFPNQRQIYLEELWKIEKSGKFSKVIERSKGAIFFENEISIIEFFE